MRKTEMIFFFQENKHMDKIFTLVNDAPNNEKDKNDLIFSRE